MGTYTADEYLETFGGLPEPGECVPDLDAIRDQQDELEPCVDCGDRAPAARETEDGPLCAECLGALELAEEMRLEGIAEDRYIERGGR